MSKKKYQGARQLYLACTVCRKEFKDCDCPDYDNHKHIHVLVTKKELKAFLHQGVLPDYNAELSAYVGCPSPKPVKFNLTAYLKEIHGPRVP